MSAAGPNKGKRYTTRKQKMVRISLSINEGLLNLVDEAAEKDFTTRSDILRQAALWYLRPQGRELDQTDPDEIFEIIRRRKAKADANKFFKQNEGAIDVYDG